MTIDRQEKCKELIKNNPTLSGNKIYELSKKKGFGIQKSKFYELVREIRDLPEPTKEKKEKSIPIKYRYPQFPELDKLPIPKKRGSYGIVEIIEDEDTSYWIKYKNKKDLNKQFKKIKDKYKPKKIKFHGIIGYKEFIEKQFEELLKIKGILL